MHAAPVLSMTVDSTLVFTQIAAPATTAQKDATECATLMENVTMMVAVITLTALRTAMGSVELMENAPTQASAAVTLTVEIAEFVERISPVPFLTAAQILTAQNTVMESVELMEVVHTQSAVKILTVSMLMEFVMFQLPMMETSVTTVIMEIVSQVVPMMG